MESQGTDTLPYTFQEEMLGNESSYTTYVHFDETPTALESQGMDGEMLQVSTTMTTTQNQTKLTEIDLVSSHEKALESQGAYQYYIHVSNHHDMKDSDSPMTKSGSISSQAVRALESQGRRSSRTHTPPSTTGCTDTPTPNTFNALESQETSCTSYDDLSALESQGKEETLSNKHTASLESLGAGCTPPAKFDTLESQEMSHTSYDDLSALESQGREEKCSTTSLESQGAGCSPPIKFDALESQEMNTISSAASEKVLGTNGISATCESSALESQGKDGDSFSPAATFDMPFADRPSLHGGTTNTSLSQKSKVTCGSDDGKGSSNSQGVVFTDSTAPSSCFIGFQPSTKVVTLGPMMHEVERWKPAFIGPSKTVLAYKHQPAPAPPITKRFFATMEAENDCLIQIE